MLKNKMNRVFQFLSDMPGWFFWSLFFVMTWFLLMSQIASLDLWWHLACGRFYVENGYYPPTGTFTFSPVNPVTSNMTTWFGDIVLYLVHLAGGDIGLQIFRAVLAIVPVLVLVLINKKKYNLWLLALAVLTITGTLQIRLLRNSMYGLLFLPFIVWLWWYIRQKDSLKFYWMVFLFPPVMGLWSIMHGYALVGTYVVFLIFAGELLDLLIRNRHRKWTKAAMFAASVVCMYFVININLSLNITGTVFSLFTSFKGQVTETTSGETLKEDNLKELQVETDQLKAEEPSCNLIDFLKNKSRFLMKGGDVGFIGEYESPFDYSYLIYVRSLFLFEWVFCLYLILALFFFRQIKFSFLLPSLAIAFIGMGYVRTTAFPFLVTGPFMAAGIRDIIKNMKVKGWLSKIKFHYFSIIPLAGLLIFFLIANYNVLSGDTSALTGAVTAGPGLGRADRHRTKIPGYVLENYIDEDMYNTYNTGSLLIWEWYGKKKVFIDGRSVTYKKEFYDDFRYNFSFTSLDKMDLRHALFNVVDDYEWFEGYLRQNWDIECFDTGMILLKRRVKEGYDNFYGNIPKFIGHSEDVDRLTLDAKNRLSGFLFVVLKYMLIFGRLDDSLTFYSDIQGIINRLPASAKQGLISEKYVMDEVEKEFGRQNSVALWSCSRKFC